MNLFFLLLFKGEKFLNNFSPFDFLIYIPY